MTRAKKLKKAIRSRAAKTGESYTSARRQVLEARRGRTPSARPAEPARSPARPRRTTGDASVRAKTGHGLDHWFSVLDAFDARSKGHSASARHLYEEHGVPGWHCQMITVEYERARGLRATNQSAAGDFQVSVTRTVPVTVPEAARLLGDARWRREWLRGADRQLGRAVQAAFDGPSRALNMKKNGLAILRFRWNATRVEIQIIGKAGGKASVVAVNTKLSGPDEVEHRRRVWTAALEGLKSRLAGGG